MKVLKLLKDGGPLSKVWGYFLVELKPVFSIVLLHFRNGSREAYHSHAFSAISWVVKGELREHILGTDIVNIYTPSIFPILTYRETFHKVISVGDTWAISLRGPWTNLWKEFIQETNRELVLTHGRIITNNE